MAPTTHGRSRLGPPPQLASIKVPVIVQMQLTRKVQPKLKEVASKHLKLMAKWFHTQFQWKQLLLCWMVILVASKMFMLALTYKFFTLASLVSLQIFHGVWTIAFFSMTMLNIKSSLPNASCLLAAYLPATTVLHILLIPRDFPLPYIIVDASTTLMAIITMFILLKIECSQILAETEQLGRHHSNSSVSDAGTNYTDLSSTRSTSSNSRVHRQGVAPVHVTLASPQYQQHPSMDERERREINSINMGQEEGVDLEPIDFEHFMEETDLESNHRSDNMFRVTYGEGPSRCR